MDHRPKCRTQNCGRLDGSMRENPRAAGGAGRVWAQHCRGGRGRYSSKDTVERVRRPATNRKHLQNPKTVKAAYQTGPGGEGVPGCVRRVGLGTLGANRPTPSSAFTGINDLWDIAVFNTKVKETPLLRQKSNVWRIGGSQDQVPSPPLRPSWRGGAWGRPRTPEPRGRLHAVQAAW